MMRLVWLKWLLLCCVARYTGGQDVCANPRITYMNHTTSYVYMDGVEALLMCGLTSSNPAQLMWWRSKEACGPFTNSTCINGNRCIFDIVDNMDYLYHCCTANGTVPSSAASNQLYCVQLSICPSMSNVTITVPPVAFFGESLVFYLALDVSPKITLTTTISFNGYSNVTFGQTVPSDFRRPRLLYEFNVPLPQNGTAGIPFIHVNGKTGCSSDLSKFLMVYVTSRDPSSAVSSTPTTKLLLSSSQPVSQATEGMSGSSSQSSNIKWRLAAIILICVVAILIFVIVGATVLYCFKYKPLAAKSSVSSSYNVDRPNEVRYNPLSGVSRDDSTPSEQIVISNGAENPIASQYNTCSLKGETSPPAYQDLTPVRLRPDLSNLTTSSPTTVEQRLPLPTLPENSTHLQQLQANAVAPTTTRLPPLNLAIQPSGVQHSHTGETPLMGFDTPLNIGSQDPFAQQFSDVTEATDHVYARPDLPVGARPAARNSGPSEVGSAVCGSGTGFSATSGQSLALEDGGSVLSRNSVSGAGRDVNTTLYSSERIQADAKRVSLSNMHRMDSISKDV